MGIFSKIGGAVSSVAKAVGGGVKAVAQTASSAVSGAVKVAGSVVGGAAGLAGSVVSGAFGLASGAVKTVGQLASTALGGIAGLAMMPMQLLGSLFGATPQQSSAFLDQMAAPNLPPEQAYGGAAQLANLQAAIVYSLQMSAMIAMAQQQAQLGAFEAGLRLGRAQSPWAAAVA